MIRETTAPQDITWLKIDEVYPYECNNKIHKQPEITKIANSIKEFGWTYPILIDENNIVLAGHKRLQAAKQLGLTEVPTIRKDDLSDAQKRAYRIIDNKSSEESEYDPTNLTLELDEIKALFDISKFINLNFDLDKIGETQDLDAQEDDYDAEPPAEPKTKYGDIYQLGNHRLMCGDSTIEEDVRKLLNNQVCELTFTDPPYQMETKGGGILKNANSMNQIRNNKVDNFNPEKLILFSDTNIYFHNKELIKKYIEIAEKNNKPYDLCFYKKNNTAPNYCGHLMTDCEYIAIIGKQDPKKGFEKELYSKCFIGEKDKENELSYSKPLELCKKFINLYGKNNILDLFGGSGSTLIACEQLNRTCYMMELDPAYCDVILQRYINFKGSDADVFLLKDGKKIPYFEAHS